MGLGKTVQVIGLLAALLGKKNNKADIMKQKPRFIREMSDNSLEDKLDEDTTYRCRPFLIIGPGSVLYNWMDELEAWGYFTVGKYHGGEKSECLSKLEKQSLEIVVTTFETFRENLSELNSVKWEAVITDEVHRIKGLKAQVTNALRSVKTRRRFGLTGTALQNNMTELWSILDWVQPGCLGSIDVFTEEFVVPIETGQKRDATKRELAMARKVKEKFAAIRNKIMLRRTKQLIADQLPQKDDNVVFCRLSDLQEQVYQFILEHPGLKHVMSMDDPCHCGSGEPRKYCCKQVMKEVTVTGLQFIFMHLLLKVSNHAALLVENPHRELSQYSKMICKSVFEEFPHFYNHTRESAFRTLSDPKYCGKMRILQRLLKVFQRDHSKVLIFSYSTRVLDIIDQYLITTGYEYRRLDGSTSMSKRSVLVREFNKDPNIFLFLISAKAGGLGLNLTGANRVIIFDPSWNPTNDLQAQDRAYRIGQWRDVHVYRLISSGTIEENIYLRQVYKQQLDSVAVGTENARRYFRGIAGDRKRYGELFGIKNMFQLHTGDSSRTMEILKQNENLEESLTEFRMAKYVPGASRRVSVGEEDQEEVGSEDSQTSEEEEDYLSKYLDLHHSDSEAEEVKSKMSKVKIKRKNSKGKDSPTKEGTLLGDEDVVHVLKNSKIVGGSRAEDHMSRCAIQDVFELHQNSQELAAHCQPLSEPESEEDVKEIKENKALSYSTTVGNKRVLIGQTPPLIRMKHFQEMTRFKKKAAMVELAEDILKSSSGERKNMLEHFYTHLHPDISNIFKKESTKMDTTLENNRKADSNKERQRKKRKSSNSSMIKKSPIKPSPCVVTRETFTTDVKKQGVNVVRKRKPPLFVPSYIEISDDGTMDTSHEGVDFSTDDLLQEIAKQNDEKNAEEVGQKEERVTEVDEERIREDIEGPSTSDTSVLDELFSPSLMARIQRKPAPKKSRQGKTKCDGSDELFSDSSSAKGEGGEEGRIRMDNTLKDDDLDCFTDPSRKRRKGSRAQKIVSRLIEESEATYNRLPKVAIGSQLDQVESCDRSPRYSVTAANQFRVSSEKTDGIAVQWREIHVIYRSIVTNIGQFDVEAFSFTGVTEMPQGKEISDASFNSGSGGQAAPPYVTLSILVAGVVGGVVIVVAVLFCCKCCSEKSKSRWRLNIRDSLHFTDIERSVTSPTSKFENAQSDLFSDPSIGSVEGILSNPRPDLNKNGEAEQLFYEASETTKLKTDFEREDYKNDLGNLEYSKEEPISPPEEPTNDKASRYTDGDFHHLKRSRIGKVPRQYSLGTRNPDATNGVEPLDQTVLEKIQKPTVSEEDYVTPQYTGNESPSPSSTPLKTEVAVEIHHNAQENKSVPSLPKFKPTVSEKKQWRFKLYSQSLDIASDDYEHKQEERRCKSYQDIGDYDVLQITEFKGPFFNTDFDAISELGSSSSSKVRYNDTGSIEQLNDENLDSLEFFEEFEMDTLRIDDSDDNETINGTQKYRDLWHLRTTFEEEEECSDTIRMEDMTSPDQSPDADVQNVFDSQANSSDDQPKGRRSSSVGSVPTKESTLNPESEIRRRTYKNILERRSEQRSIHCSPNAENSFDSITTVDTDGDRSDTSRPEVTTTSFESTTDNTDSTTESQNHKLIQMKADSGYKSLETPNPSHLFKRNHSTGEIEEEIVELEPLTEKLFVHAHSLPESGSSGERAYFDRRTGKTASRKRREYRRERQMVQVYESINEPESDSKSDQQSVESLKVASPSSKFSVFSRLFKSNKDHKEKQYATRDYSIDEKSNRVFQEFLRFDPALENRPRSASQPRIHLPKHRLHRKHSDVKYFEERRRDRLAPDKRSLSLGSDSSTSSIRRLSPQDSIEEEDYEDVRKEEEESKSCDPLLQRAFSGHMVQTLPLPEEEIGTEEA
ncbi:LOW QUALITY PROTEIN: DNA excision repair protein ERCC-6-like 2 [Saccostrea cucullata]|uniref:LOW QUALITY PROTEIN: DNA excision repair protein ERCC-6-like 2 n=1 Tax=Saccostrea cuccullata TaxID=36930 RepID=UPI002ED05C63